MGKESIEKANYNFENSNSEMKKDSHVWKEDTQEISENEEINKYRVLPHIVRCNEQRTGDGVIQGGLRLANEINEMVHYYKTTNYPNLKYISIVGNSLGGLYARFALSEIKIFEKETVSDKQFNENEISEKPEATGDNETLQMGGGLLPHTFLTTVSPHLGAKSFTYIPLPEAVFPVLGKVMGQTGSDLLLMDHVSSNRDSPSNIRTNTSNHLSPLLYRMSDEENFLKPLRAFKHRVCYGNFQGDHLVPTQSALFHPSIKQDLKNRFNKVEKEEYLNKIATRTHSFEEENIAIYELSSSFNDEFLFCNDEKDGENDEKNRDKEVQQQWERKIAQNLNEKSGKWEKYIR